MPPVREINISDIKVLASKAGGYIARSAVKETSFLQHAESKGYSLFTLLPRTEYYSDKQALEHRN